MNDKVQVYGRLSFLTTWPMVALLFALLWLCTVGFAVRAKWLGPAPDSEVWYTPGQLHARLARFGLEGRNIYALTELTLDLVFPTIYAGLFAGLIGRVFSPKTASWLALAPLLALCCDLAENFQFSYFAWTFQEDIVPWSYFAALSTAAKFVCVAVSIGVLLVGAWRKLPSDVAIDTWPVQLYLLLLCLGGGLGLLMICLYEPPRVKPVEWKVTFLHLNDTYEITPLDGDRSGGLARVATLRKKLMQENPHTYTLHAGDFLSPSALGNAVVKGKRLAGEQMTAVLKAAGVDYLTFGNHEFDLTQAEFVDRLNELTSMGRSELSDDAGRIQEAWDESQALFSTNVRDAEGRPFPNVPTNRLLTIRHPEDGRVLLRIGLIALTTDSGADKIPYAKFRKPIAAAQEQLRDWQRSREKPDVVIALTHESLSEDEELASTVPGIDLILGGHEHENVHRRALPDLYRAARALPSIYRADANVRTVFIHDLSFDLRNRRLLRIHSHLKAVTDATEEDAEVKAVIEKYVQQAFHAFRAKGLQPDEILGKATKVLDGRESMVRNTGTLLTDLIGAAMLDTLKKEAAQDRRAAVYNSGAIRIDDFIRPGDITMYDILRVLPYSGDVWSVPIKGEMLKRILEAADRGKGTGEYLQTANIKIKGNGTKRIWLIGGQELDPNADYRLAINDYLLEGHLTGLAFLRSLKNIAGGRRIDDWRKVVGAFLKSNKRWPGR